MRSRAARGAGTRRGTRWRRRSRRAGGGSAGGRRRAPAQQATWLQRCGGSLGCGRALARGARPSPGSRGLLPAVAAALAAAPLSVAAAAGAAGASSPPLSSVCVPPAAPFAVPGKRARAEARVCILDFTRLTVREQVVCYIRSIKADSASKRPCACFMSFIKPYHTDGSNAKF